jgi:outer membrane protein
MKKQLLLISSLVIMFLKVQAIDLFETYQKALAYNADYLSAIALNQAGQEQQNIARAALLPQITATGSLTENYFNQGGVQAYYHQPIYSASLNQVVFDFSKFSAYTKGKFATQLSDLQLLGAQQQLMVNVAQAYFDVLYAEDTLLATRMTKEALKQQMVQAQAAFKVGSVTVADVNDAMAGYDSAAAQEIQDTNNLIFKKNIFRNLTGVDPEQIQPIQDELKLTLPSPSSDASWSSMAESGNVNNRIAGKQIDMAKQDILMSRSGHFPIVLLNAQYQYQDTAGLDATNATPTQMQMFNIPGSVLSNYSTGSVGLQVSIPISSGGAVNAQTRQAIDVFESSQQQYVYVKRQTDQNIRNAYWNVQNGVSIVKAQKAALLSAKTKLASDKLGYQVGIRNSVDLVASQKNYYQTFQTYQQARYNYLMAEIQLQYLSGLIDGRFMQNINANIKN